MIRAFEPAARNESVLVLRAAEHIESVRAEQIALQSRRLSIVRVVAAVLLALVAHLSGAWRAWAPRESTLWITDGYLLFALAAAAIVWRWPRSTRWAGYFVTFGDLTAGSLFQLVLVRLGRNDVELVGLQLATSVLLLLVIQAWHSTRLLVATVAMSLGWHLLLLAEAEKLNFGGGVLNGFILVLAAVVSAIKLKSRQRLELEIAREYELERDAARQRDEAVDTLARVLAALPHAVVVHRDGTLITDNDLAARLLQWERGAQPRVAFEGDTTEGETDPLRRMGKPFTANWSRADGKILPVEIANVELHLTEGPAILSMVRDLSEARALENQALQADRLATLGAMASSVAHELNNPLTVVQAITQSLTTPSKGPNSVEERDEMLADLAAATRQLCAIVQDLRTFARRDTDETRPVELKTVIERAVRLTAPAARYKAKVVVELTPAPPVLGNETRLTQVLTNLLVNAAHAIPEGKAAANQITVRLMSGAQGEAVLEVSDTGQGMSEETKARLYEPFFTTKPAGVGTGLGLSICKQIVTALKGTIEVESELGRGATFRILLPAAT